ncbi:MAG TPA: orotidine-5'-phosphate decarboxylase [Candidatus Dormibacteraeota bacterium]|nr:orotidine-5'-phosphate decarboxylase [Candidatus Dormibacteraeota bacterium]
MDFISQLSAAWTKNDSLLCVGLDPNIDKLPKHLLESETPFFDFGKAIIDATADLVCAFKPNSAFYEARGAAGIEELKRTCEYIRQNYPDIPIILDFKRGDIDSTNSHYTTFAFDYLGVDAVTVQPYEGRQAFQPFLDRKDKGIIVLCRMSNVGSDEFQDMLVDGRKLYVHVAEHVRDEWNANGNCLLVVGATYPKELAEIRSLVGDKMIFLVPGLGAQGGDAEATVRSGVTSDGKGLIINSSRAIIYASSGEDFADAARQAAIATRDEINSYRKEVQA